MPKEAVKHRLFFMSLTAYGDGCAGGIAPLSSIFQPANQCVRGIAGFYRMTLSEQAGQAVNMVLLRLEE